MALGGPHRLREAWDASVYMIVWSEVALVSKQKTSFHLICPSNGSG